MQDKFFSSNKYDEIVTELYQEEIIDDNDLDIIQNNINIDKNEDLELYVLKITKFYGKIV